MPQTTARAAPSDFPRPWRIRGSRLPILLLLSVIGFGQSPSDDTSVGVWPWLVGNINSSTPAIIAQAQAAGLDTIYLHLYGADSSTQFKLFMADEAGTWNPANGPIDARVTLTSFLQQAHAAQLQVIGVLNCFYESGPFPGDPAHEQKLLAVVDYLVNTFTPSGDPRYALDGIALDRCRWYTGTGNPTAPVTSFVSTVKSRLGLLPLHAFVMANLYSLDGPTYNGLFNSYAATMATLQSQFGQHWENLAPSLDAILPMAYIAQGGVYGSNTTLMQAYVQTCASYARTASIAGGHPEQRVLPAIRAWTDSSGTTTAATLDASMLGSIVGGDGFMAFRYFTMQGQTSWWNQVALRSDPGQDRPLARLTQLSLGGYSVRLDASTSTSQAVSAATLEARFDFNDDGVADTPFSTNRVVTWLAPGPGSYRMSCEVRDPSGRRSVLKRRVQIGLSALSIPSASVSIASGGLRPLQLDLGPAGAGISYMVGISSSGSSPGLSLSPTITLRLNWDALTDLGLQLLNSPILPSFAGTLDVTGHATPILILPPQVLPSSLAWTSLTFAAVGFQASSGSLVFGTNAATLLLLP